jgi:hypothetical protein
MTDREGQNASEKPSLERTDLEAHGIFIDEGIHPLNSLDGRHRILLPHVESLRQALLNLQIHIPSYERRGITSDLNEYLVRVKQTEQNHAATEASRKQGANVKSQGTNEDGGNARSAWEIRKDFTLSPPDSVYEPRSSKRGGKIFDIDQYTEAAEDAKWRVEKRQNERGWMHYLRDYVFREFGGFRTKQQYVS